MKSFIPFDITDAVVVSSSIDEPSITEPTYSSETIYAEFDQVSVITTDSHLVYESLVAGNVGNAVTDDTKWILKGNTNKWRMFDFNQGNPSVAASPLTIVLRPGKRIDAIALDLKASVVDISVKNGIDGITYFTLDGYLLERNVSTFYEFFYAPFVYRRLVTTFEVPPIPDPVIYITITDHSGVVELSRVAFGLSVDLGTVQWSATIDAENYSKITYDDFGKATLLPRPSVPKNDIKLVADRSRIKAITQYKEATDAKAAVWSGLGDIDYEYTEPLIMFGAYKSFNIDLTSPSYVVVTLSLKGI